MGSREGSTKKRHKISSWPETNAKGNEGGDGERKEGVYLARGREGGFRPVERAARFQGLGCWTTSIRGRKKKFWKKKDRSPWGE